MKSFGSDNYAGVHPDILDALLKSNTGHARSYGNDDFTARAVRKFKSLFGQETEVFFVYNGTAANVLGLSTITRSFHSILCAEAAHINVDESTAPETFLGCKLVAISSPDGKLGVDETAQRIQRLGDPHHPQVKVISISQASEYGTVYSMEELQALSALARKHNLFLHMDGSRIANAAASLGKSLRDFTRDAGVDVLSFGGTKNGMMFGEAILFFRQELARDFMYTRKQGMQLHSKMRFIAAQFEALLTNDLWLSNARQSNAMARLLEQELRQVKGVTITQKVEANGVFASVPPHVIDPLQKDFPFYPWNEKINEIRLMCSWDTTDNEVLSFVARLRELVGD